MSFQGGSNIVYLGNIPFEWDESVVGSVVYGSGEIIDIRMGYDHVGKNKGFCFVEYRNGQQAAAAIPLLSQIVVYSSDRPRRLRIELSKESYKSNSIPPETRPTLQLSRANLPSTVKLPDQMIINGPNNSPIPGQNAMRSGNIPPRSQPQPQQPSQQFPVVGGPNQQIPQKLLHASQNFPPNLNIQLGTPDTIDKILSSVPPPHLIEAIANLKSMLQADPARLHDFLQKSPQMLLPIAQALLLMGFIDGDVINESQKATSASSTPAGFQNPLFAPNPPANNYNAVPGSKWPQLPIETQRKLLALSPAQADQAANFLLMPSEQINNLPPEERAALISFKREYFM
ncbi:PTI1 Protein PTI1 [Candida maltosa Xu316]